MAENPLNFVNYGTNNQALWQQHPEASASVTAFSNQSIQNSSWTTKMLPSNNPMSSQVGSSVNVLSYLQQHPNSFPVNDSVQPLFHDSSAEALTYNYPPSCSVTHHLVNSVRTNPVGQSDTSFQPQMLPNFSTTPFSSTILPLDAPAPISAVPLQASSFSCLPDQDTNPDSVVSYAQCLPPVSTQPLTSVAYRSNARNESDLLHNFPIINKHSQSQLLNDHYQMNGNYPGGMGSLQQEFAKMNYGIKSIRYVDLMQERDLMKYGTEDEEIALPPTVCNPDARCNPSIFRCTLSSVPQTQELLKKSRLPFGLTLQPFRDMKNLNIIQTSSIVRCRYCRTYINPYIYLPDSRHWKCNICYRVNDLPDDFNWDPATKSFGEPTHRPEIKNSTVEFIAPSEYMLRPPQPAVYVFVMDISQNAVETGYLYTFTEQLLITLEQLPGDDRTMLGFIGVDSAVHFFQFRGKARPQQLVVEEYSDIFLPVNCGLLVNLRKNIDVIRLFVQSLPALYESNSSTSCCLGAALTAAHKLIADIGGRITVLLTVIPDLGPGALKSREDPNQRAASEVSNLYPANDYYKRLALECTGHQIAVDLFLMNSQYSDLSTLADMSKFSTGCIFHFPNYHINHDQVQVKRFQKQLNRYLVRKIGFEAVLRIRCTKGLSLHTFYGNFFVRSTDLLAMANINPDSAIAVQVQMEENLIGINTACFQAAVLYTSSRGDRRIRIHTLCLPVTKDLSTIFSQFDVKCAVSLLSKMAVERTFMGVSLTDSREAMVNTVVDVFGAYNSAVSRMNRASSMLSPVTSIRLLPLYVLGMLKHRAFTAGQSIRLDNRVAALLIFRSAPLEVIDLELYPALYELNHFVENEADPPRLHLSFEHISRDGVYLLDTGSYVYIYISSNVESSIIKRLFDVNTFEKIDDDNTFEALDNPLSNRVHSFLRKLSIYRTVFAPVILIREDSPVRSLFSRRLIDDRTESSHSYIEFLSYIRQEMRK
ncbi:Sec23/Sec24 trunk domain-containing protein [Loa loa]|uniref:Sec23/Sec24 trunk domain-containing protein n=1 Tax=Loa loa TaxID=7209 RepID=A0A1I7V8W2_LOALO|nr:Sec23/Sec24 trunk domain-containing protein [Loa loa]EFO26433.2 Sec23/Sec24 trunk domain-containing protein [Loa loa]